MQVTVDITDYSNPAQPGIRIHNAWCDGSKAELEIDGKRYRVSIDEMISALQKVRLNSFGY